MTYRARVPGTSWKEVMWEADQAAVEAVGTTLPLSGVADESTRTRAGPNRHRTAMPMPGALTTRTHRRRTPGTPRTPTKSRMHPKDRLEAARYGG